MTEKINITATGTLHKILDDEGSIYRFVSSQNPLISGVIFKQEEHNASTKVERFKNVRFKLKLEIEQEHDYKVEVS